MMLIETNCRFLKYEELARVAFYLSDQPISSPDKESIFKCMSPIPFYFSFIMQEEFKKHLPSFLLIVITTHLLCRNRNYDEVDVEVTASHSSTYKGWKRGADHEDG